MGFNWAFKGLSKYCRPAEGVLTAYCAIHFVWIEEMCASAIEFSAIAKCLLSRLETGWGGGSTGSGVDIQHLGIFINIVIMFLKC